jgi:hypothetical protein
VHSTQRADEALALIPPAFLPPRLILTALTRVHSM